MKRIIATLVIAIAPGFVSAQDAPAPMHGLSTRPTVLAFNRSKETKCSENHNINIPLTSQNVKSFYVEAMHPTYNFKHDNCEPSFENCPDPISLAHTFQPVATKLFDNGDVVVEAVRDVGRWDPQGMRVSVDSGDTADDVHYVRMYKQVGAELSWPQYLVFYKDGYMRTTPQPRPGVSNVCFGSYVLVGPASVADKPEAPVKSIQYFADAGTMKINYVEGGSATIELASLDRNMCRVRVSVDYNVADRPFATFISMYVDEGNADVDHVWWKNADGSTFNEHITDFRRGRGNEWVFFRRSRSIHNTSAPNIRIRTEN